LLTIKNSEHLITVLSDRLINEAPHDTSVFILGKSKLDAGSFQLRMP